MMNPDARARALSSAGAAPGRQRLSTRPQRTGSTGAGWQWPVGDIIPGLVRWRFVHRRHPTTMRGITYSSTGSDAVLDSRGEMQGHRGPWHEGESVATKSVATKSVATKSAASKAAPA